MTVRRLQQLGFGGKVVGFAGLTDSDAEAFHQLGVSTVLEKPLDLQLVIEVIAGVWRGLDSKLLLAYSSIETSRRVPL